MNEQIFKYLDGVLNDKEKVEFEKSLNTDNDLKDQVAQCKNLNALMEKESEFKAIQQRVMDTNKRYEQAQQKDKTKVLFLRWGSAAASVVVATGFTWYIVSDQSNPQSIYKNNFSAWNQKNITRGDFKNEDLVLWEELYSNKNYQVVIENYSLLNSEEKTSPQVALMMGCALMEQEKYSDAIKVFNTIDTEEYYLFNAEVNWYKGLCLLKTKSKEQAIPYFKTLVEDKKYGSKAKKILKRIQ